MGNKPNPGTKDCNENLYKMTDHIKSYGRQRSSGHLKASSQLTSTVDRPPKPTQIMSSLRASLSVERVLCDGDVFVSETHASPSSLSDTNPEAKKIKLSLPSIAASSKVLGRLQPAAETNGMWEPLTSDRQTVTSSKKSTSVTGQSDKENALQGGTRTSESVAAAIPHGKTKVPLEFLRKFKKNFKAMTRNELECFVLTKIVEALTCKNGYADMQTKIDNQNQLIIALRTKLDDLSKQFKDLERLHKRIEKDFNAGRQDSARLKLTRGVGVQVVLGRKHHEPPTASSSDVALAIASLSDNNAVSLSEISNQLVEVPTARTEQKDNAAAAESVQLQTARDQLQCVLKNKTGRHSASSEKSQDGSSNIDNRLAVNASKSSNTAEHQAPQPGVERSPTITPSTSSGTAWSSGRNKKQRIGVRNDLTMISTIDLTDDDNETPKTGRKHKSNDKVVYSTSQSNLLARLMAALPMPASIANNIEWKRPPPRVVVKNVKRATNKIILAFQLSDMTGDHAKIMAYQMYAYTHTGSEDRSSNILWRSLGVVDAQPLPMSVTLTQEETKDQFYFSVRAVDEHQRTGLFSVPRTW